MKSLSTSEIRGKFLEFFQEKKHMIEPGVSLIPDNDPTLLWINSGVSALKKYFDGTTKALNPRIVNVQKSIRTNDIENVGLTSRHQTFFEMLGNFSIGDYFKKEAIEYAWEFLTSPKWLGMDAERFYISVHSDDEEAYRIWVDEIGISSAKILKTEGNFWEIGAGPCGPNSEIFYDRGELYDPKNSGEELFFKELENNRYVEIWNIVFSQYNAVPGRSRKDYQELPQKNIDTGMGLERLACLLQDVETNYDIDIFQPLIIYLENKSPHKYLGEHKLAYKVIVDHIRTVCFALTDGAVFSNEGRGYVLRRVLRRAVRFGLKLEIEGVFLKDMVSLVATIMGDFYPELLEKQQLVENLVQKEEERFMLTINDGEKLLKSLILEKLEKNQKRLSGQDVFKMYDTYGFPVELTQEIAGEFAITIDLDGFEKEMQQQKSRARAARAEEGSMQNQNPELLKFEEPFSFVGYNLTEIKAEVTGILVSEKLVSKLDSEGWVLFDKSPFYAESGGQIYDLGTVSNSSFLGEVLTVIKAPQGQFLHRIKVKKGNLKIGEKCLLKVDFDRRQKIMANHSSVHLLQYALQTVIGSHINQAGSFVGDEYARFDFTHHEKITETELEMIEKKVNGLIFKNLPVKVETMSLQLAKAKGAMALFNEKYGAEVRVVEIGPSLELCGGTHVTKTSEIGMFKIISEESIGSGIRRITSITRESVYDYLLNQDSLLERIASQVKAPNIKDIQGKIESLSNQVSLMKVELEQERLKVLSGLKLTLKKEFVTNSKVKLLVKKLLGYDANLLKKLAQELSVEVSEGLIVLASILDQTIILIVACGQKALQEGFKAGEIVKDLASSLGGKGGGKPDLAQAGAKDIANLESVLTSFEKKILESF